MFGACGSLASLGQTCAEIQQRVDRNVCVLVDACRAQAFTCASAARRSVWVSTSRGIAGSAMLSPWVPTKTNYKFIKITYRFLFLNLPILYKPFLNFNPW